MGYIYVITNQINNKQYVGQTTKSIEERFQEHIYCSKSDRLKGRPLYSAIRKYGADNFNIALLEECQNDELNEKEVIWIDRLNTYRNGYNATIGGDGIRKPMPSFDEILAYYTEHPNISLVQTGQHFGLCANTIHDILIRGGYSEIRSHPTKQSYQKNPLYNYKDISEKYKELLNTKEVANYFHCSTEVVVRACQKYGVDRIGVREQVAKLCGKTVYQIDKTSGEIIQSFPSFKDAGRFLGNENYSSNISACCRGKQKTAYGYRWTTDRNNYTKGYIENSKKRAVLQLDIDTLEVLKEFPSVADAAEELYGTRENNVSKTIAGCARNEFYSCYGYSWLYKDLYEQGETKKGR